MKSIKFILLICFFTLFSCKEQRLEAQKTVVGQKGVIEKIVAVDFRAKVEGQAVQLIDVRTPSEYNEGHIPLAKNVNFYDTNFLTQLAGLDKNKPVYLYCKSGGRSGKASKRLHNAGFMLVYDLKGGFSGWETEGFPIRQQ